MNGTKMNTSVIVIGGGAAGMMAATVAARSGADVILFEKNEKMGRKLRITGKGRCNVTNDCDKNEFLSNVASNSKFLFAAISRFSTADTKDFFEECGVPLKVERGKRVFPVSDKAQDIVSAMENACAEAGVTVINKRVEGILVEDGKVEGVVADGERYGAKCVIVCTGGASYPRTGSSGDGYRFAKKMGHKVVPIRPSLVPLVAEGTAAFGAKLIFETLPAKFLCRDCGYEGAADRKNACCFKCGSSNLKMTAGREFFVDSLKVE